jgi:hypothetical protein
MSRRLTTHCIEGGRLREGVRTCYRVLNKDRSNEDAHGLLMECFVRLRPPRAAGQGTAPVQILWAGAQR